MKTAEEFVNALKVDSVLAEKLKALLTSVDKADNNAQIDAVVKLAREAGYDVSEKNFAPPQPSWKKLDDDELDMTYGGDDERVANWSCEYCGSIWVITYTPAPGANTIYICLGCLKKIFGI